MWRIGGGCDRTTVHHCLSPSDAFEGSPRTFHSPAQTQTPSQALRVSARSLLFGVQQPAIACLTRPPRDTFVSAACFLRLFSVAGSSSSGQQQHDERGCGHVSVARAS